ncbi:cyclin-U4-1-like [Impatiens glandulifera]|uniref:cyclin-U4-1-like n=1 Tax=Impatiens glandulifera TaxID=253017 RepID=UPI001FB15D8A|nr:cyclin-U4-1-like [Impatiens glandulifera]
MADGDHELAESSGGGGGMPRLIRFLPCLLQRVAESNDLNDGGLKSQKMSVFQGLSRPNISIESYLERIFKYANCSPSCFIVAYLYLDRFQQRQPSLPINSFNVHRLLITSVMLAAKFMDDIYYNNAYYAKVGGISIGEMNFLEVDFLFGLGFHLNVTPTTFYTYCSYLQNEMTTMMIQPSLHLSHVDDHDHDHDHIEDHQVLPIISRSQQYHQVLHQELAV